MTRVHSQEVGFVGMEESSDCLLVCKADWGFYQCGCGSDSLAVSNGQVKEVFHPNIQSSDKTALFYIVVLVYTKTLLREIFHCLRNP